MGERAAGPSPTFSIVVPTFGRPALLREALASVQAQTRADFECLVVDDGSHTAAAEMPAHDDRFRLLDLPVNGGEARARNAGAAAAVGAVLCFLDDDDVLAAHRLELAATLDATAPLGVCGTSWLGSAGPGTVRPLDGAVGDVILDSYTPQIGSVSVRRTAFRPFDERYPASSDVEWLLRLTQDLPVASITTTGVYIRRHDGVRVGNGTEARLRGDGLLFEHHGAYLGCHRRARAFRRYRQGWMQAELGQRRAAAFLLARSLAVRPSLRAGRALASVVLTGRP